MVNAADMELAEHEAALELLAAYERGREAAEDGHPVKDCPHSLDEAHARVAWCGGWSDGFEGVPRERSANYRRLASEVSAPA